MPTTKLTDFEPMQREIARLSRETDELRKLCKRLIAIDNRETLKDSEDDHDRSSWQSPELGDLLYDIRTALDNAEKETGG